MRGLGIYHPCAVPAAGLWHANSSKPGWKTSASSNFFFSCLQEQVCLIGLCSSYSHIPHPWADPECRSTSGFCDLNHRSIRIQNCGILLFGSSEGSAEEGSQTEPGKPNKCSACFPLLGIWMQATFSVDTVGP